MSPQLTINREIITGPPKDRKALLRELAVAIAELRQDAKEKGVDKMSKREINASVTWARRDLRKTRKHAAR
jgi:hypothetical protein